MAKWKEDFYKIEHSPSLNQGSLFKKTRTEFLNDVGVDLRTLKQWYELNLLSFNPEKLDIFDERELEETKFIKTLMRSGLSFEKVTNMLAKLNKPYCYNFSEMFWDFEEEAWISIDRLVEDRCEEYLAQNVEEIIDRYLYDFVEKKQEEGNYKDARIFDLGDYLIIKKT